VEGAEPEEPEDHESGPDCHETPFCSPPGQEHSGRAEQEDHHQLNGDPGIGFRHDQVDHHPARQTVMVSAVIRLRLMVSRLALTPKTVPSGISNHSSLLSGSDATTTAL
jgi:hypothetical protein